MLGNVIHLNHNVFSGWESLKSTTARTVWSRSMQNSFMLGGITKMGLGFTTFYGTLGSNLGSNSY